MARSQANIMIFGETTLPEYVRFLRANDIDLDIYYQPEFLQIESELHGGMPEVFTASSGADYFIYPYMKRRLEFGSRQYWELASPFGYWGPWASSQAMFDIGESCFLEHVRAAEDVVSEEVRYHCIYNGGRLFVRDIRNYRHRCVVLIDLTQSWNRIWQAEFSPRIRNAWRRLEREGCRFELASDRESLDEFRHLYYQTMDDAGADRFFYFDRAVFSRYYESLAPGKLVLARVVKNGITLSAALFLISGGIMTYFLSARNTRFPKVSGTSYLLARMAAWGASRGLKMFNLGGGSTNGTGDSLSRFKGAFSRTVTPFYMGHRVHRADILQSIAGR